MQLEYTHLYTLPRTSIPIPMSLELVTECDGETYVELQAPRQEGNRIRCVEDLIESLYLSLTYWYLSHEHPLYWAHLVVDSGESVRYIFEEAGVIYTFGLSFNWKYAAREYYIAHENRWFACAQCHRLWHRDDGYNGTIDCGIEAYEEHGYATQEEAEQEWCIEKKEPDPDDLRWFFEDIGFEAYANELTDSDLFFALASMFHTFRAQMSTPEREAVSEHVRETIEAYHRYVNQPDNRHDMFMWLQSALSTAHNGTGKGEGTLFEDYGQMFGVDFEMIGDIRSNGIEGVVGRLDVERYLEGYEYGQTARGLNRPRIVSRRRTRRTRTEPRTRRYGPCRLTV